MKILLTKKNMTRILALVTLLSTLYAGSAYAASGSVYKTNDGIKAGLYYTSYTSNGYKLVKDGRYLGATGKERLYYAEDSNSLSLTDSGRTYLLKTTGTTYYIAVGGTPYELSNKTRSYEFGYRTSY